MKNESSEPKEIDFEQSLKRLEEVVELLEKGRLPWRNPFACFMRG